MKLVPFVISTPYKVPMFEHEVSLYRIAILLDNGKSIWEEDSRPISDITSSCLGQNEITPFPESNWKTMHDVVYIPVDNKSTQIQQFVSYEEGYNQEGLIWRTFYYFYDTKQEKSFLDSWNYPTGIEKILNNALKVWHVLKV
jgi:hypothetical protein